MKLTKCCICGREFAGYGHNPIPIKPVGKCCNACQPLVAYRRIQLAKQEKNNRIIR